MNEIMTLSPPPLLLLLLLQGELDLKMISDKMFSLKIG